MEDERHRQYRRFTGKIKYQPYHSQTIAKPWPPHIIGSRSLWMRGNNTTKVSILNEVVALVLGIQDNPPDTWADVQQALEVLANSYTYNRKARRAGVEDAIDNYHWRHALQRKDWKGHA